MAQGEFDLIARITERMPAPGPRVRIASGDDAAVAEPGGAATATTIDTVTEGVHFTLPEYPFEAVGRKALAAALSDLAAMGAEPGEAYVALGAPETMGEADLLAVADGLAEVAGREGVTVAGGDLTRSPVLTLTVACVGYERADSTLVSRDGAEPGHAVVVTGELGGAAGAIQAIREGTDDPALLNRQFDPAPRFAEGAALADSGARAMIDVSDGLGADAGHVAKASGVRLEIDLDAVPLGDGVVELVGEERARELAVSGGEDFELLAAVPEDRLDAARSAAEATGTPLTQIGRIVPGEGVSIRGAEGEGWEAGGFDHMRGSPPPGS